jgi:hypothetical protein
VRKPDGRVHCQNSGDLQASNGDRSISREHQSCAGRAAS